MNLNNLRAIKKLDQNQVADSIANLPQQLATAWETGRQLRIPSAFGQASNIVFCGMGGSNLASELAKRVFSRQIKKPLVLVRNYHLPAFVDDKTLVIINSYSGDTEETISCLKQARDLTKKIICISTGGKIARLARQYRLAYLKINPIYNPSSQPRYDVGSQLGAALSVLTKLKLIKINTREINALAQELADLGSSLLPESKNMSNQAKQLAKKLINKNIYVVAAEHLSANAHILANQINESAKQLASPYKIPELNHHFLDALGFPRRVIRDTAFIFLVSPDYSERIARRFAITKKTLDHRKIFNLKIIARQNPPLMQALEILTMGSWISFYLAILNRQNPALNHWVHYLKQELER